ncbi:histidine phosphatase family protein [Pseudanabaena sp. FACHB-1277]|jgi:broad specificity phosphatase PhoE|uniref:Histidine phosphatase family protein n=1 Tax=Pseudanabaena cinerea FACHB-1277 TaxID=2949581 RepID=A0A926UU89_9CYAN|nr:histidine phosphatase family protein [Pseudanabaena cinerea]MBD2151232.1 histidine phosphatase family protein [Pseudanabaena cinerea FACHB-1277]
MIQNIVAIASTMMISAVVSFRSDAQSGINDEWSALRGKGKVVLMRHAIAPGTGDPEQFKIDDCSTQRNLSEEGRAQARQAGAEFRKRRIPIQQVLSSQWCRCLETAKLLNLGEVKPEPALNSFFRDRSTEDAQTIQTRRLIVEHQQQDGVVVMVTHQVNITALTGIVPRSGAAVVVQANTAGDVTVIAELDP